MNERSARESLVRDLNERVRLVGFPAPLGFSWQVAPIWVSDDVFLRVMLSTKDRDSGIEMCVHRAARYAPVFYDELPRKDAVARLAEMTRRELMSHLAHEIDECLLVDGVRVFDPHRDEPSSRAHARKR